MALYMTKTHDVLTASNLLMLEIDNEYRSRQCL